MLTSTIKNMYVNSATISHSMLTNQLRYDIPTEGYYPIHKG